MSAWRVAASLVTEALVEALLPSRCVACAQALGRLRGPTCVACERRHALEARAIRCLACSAAMTGEEPALHCTGCSARAPTQAHVVVEAPHAHAGVARSLVHALKYGRRVDVAERLARALAGDARVASRLAEVDVVVPVPADPVRRRERGFNPATLVAESLCELAGARRLRACEALAVRRARPQVGRSGSSRRIAPRGTMRGAWLARRSVRGRRVLLVDDVTTTGATLAEAVRVLRRLGASSVVAVACTRADGVLELAPWRPRARTRPAS